MRVLTKPCIILAMLLAINPTQAVEVNVGVTFLMAEEATEKATAPVPKPSFGRKKKKEVIPPPFDVVVWRPFTSIPAGARIIPNSETRYEAPAHHPHSMRHKPMLNFIMSKDAQGYYLFAEGKIDRHAYSRFLHLLINYRERGISFNRLMMHSPGGYLQEAMKIGQYIYDNDWAVDADLNTECYSACGMIFAAGKQKRMQQGAKIGFHRPYLPHQPDTKASVELAYEASQPYWQAIQGNEALYQKFMGQYSRDQMLVLDHESIAEYMTVKTY